MRQSPRRSPAAPHTYIPPFVRSRLPQLHDLPRPPPHPSIQQFRYTLYNKRPRTISMSGLPPTLNAETGTPAHEWAQSTTTAAFAREQPAAASGVSSLPPGVQQARTASSSSTPGIPGAYPSETSGPVNTQAMTQAAKDAMNTVTSTAQQYLPIVQETAAQAAQRAAEVASQATQAAQSYICT